LYELFDIDIVFVVPERIDCSSSKTKPGKINKELEMFIEEMKNFVVG
jgi:hypothetical protein